MTATTTDWKALYEACTPDERLEVVQLALEKLEARRASALALLMASPLQLAALPVSRLREVSCQAMEGAHSWIVTNFPDVAGILVALECLTSFSETRDEPTAADLRDVLSSIEDVWKATGGGNDFGGVPSVSVATKAEPA